MASSIDFHQHGAMFPNVLHDALPSLSRAFSFLLRLLNHSQTLVESGAQDGDTFKEISAAFQVKGDLKNALSSAFR